MEENILSDYNRLMEAMKKTEGEYEFNVYEKVNDTILTILSQSSDGVKKLEALICTFEARGTNNAFYATLALAYVVVSFYFGLFTSIFDVNKNKPLLVVTIAIVGVTALILFGSALKEQKLEQNRSFILNLLRFRHEELKNKEVLDHKTEDREEDSKKINKNKKVQ